MNHFNVVWYATVSLSSMHVLFYWCYIQTICQPLWIYYRTTRRAFCHYMQSRGTFASLASSWYALRLSSFFTAENESIHRFPGIPEEPVRLGKREAIRQREGTAKRNHVLGGGLGRGFASPVSFPEDTWEHNLISTWQPWCPLGRGTLGPCPATVKQEAIKACEQGP